MEAEGVFGTEHTTRSDLTIARSGCWIAETSSNFNRQRQSQQIRLLKMQKLLPLLAGERVLLARGPSEATSKRYNWNGVKERETFWCGRISVENLDLIGKSQILVDPCARGVRNWERGGSREHTHRRTSTSSHAGTRSLPGCQGCKSGLSSVLFRDDAQSSLLFLTVGVNRWVTS